MTRLGFSAILGILMLSSGVWGVQNNPPVVNAGHDTTFRLGQTFRFFATATDDSLLNAQLQYQWTQVDGPAGGADIRAPGAKSSLVVFSMAGAYVFQLSAYDGEFTVVDSISVTVQEDVPFLVLTPTGGENIELGSTYEITWQIGLQADLRVELSTDGGINFQTLTTARLSGSSWLWTVGTDLPQSDACYIQLSNYDNHSISTLSGLFSLVPRAGVLDSRHRPPVAVRPGRLETYSLDGRHLPAGALHTKRLLRCY